jgi:hypothetical protein
MALSDVRPDAADLLFRSGTTVTRDLVFPADTLDGRTFTSTLDGDPLDLSMTDDVITIVASAAVTAALPTGVPVEWLLLEDIDGTPEPILIGTWTPSDSPNAGSGDTLQLTQGADQVTVTSSSNQASIVALSDNLTAHEDDQTAHGDPLAAVATVVGDLTTHEATEGAHGWTVVEPPTLTGDRLLHNGPILTNHDYRLWTPEMLVQGTGQAGHATYTPGGDTDVGMSSWLFPAGVTTRVKFAWLVPDGWEALTIRIGFLTPGFQNAGAGDVVWRYSHAGTCIGASTVTAVSEIDRITVPNPGPVGTALAYQDLAPDVPSPTLACPFGGFARSVVERLGDDPDDTFGFDIALIALTATRMNPV